MAERNLKTTIWAVVIIFMLISSSMIVFLMVWIPPRNGGAGIKVAILDSGIDMNAKIMGYKASRELKEAIIAEKSFITTEFGYETNETVLDETQYNHGTLVALQIASRSIGIAPESKLIIAKCADNEGIASYPAIFAALDWVVDEEDADIINISLGGPILKNDSIVEKINRITKEKGVLVVISSGNSGDASGYSTSSIEGPGDALQAITVGAYTSTGVAEYSSVGPIRDHSIKPDLVDLGFTLIAIGTSFAAPKVAGKAAVLMSWCLEQGYKTTPGLLKAALMASASTEFVYTIYYAGAGVADVENAKAIITNAQKINDLPMVNYIMPEDLPFSLAKSFRGDVWNFPLTVISSTPQYFNITSNLDSSDSIIRVPSSVLINQTGLVDCKLVIPSDHPLGDHEETITLESDTNDLLEVSVEVEIEEPNVRIGFDIYHSAWQIDHLFGQFRELNLKLAEEGIALTELNSLDNFSHLTDYDALIIANPNSYGSYLDDERTVQNYYVPFKNSTINYITEYVNAGYGLFIMGTTYDSSALNETNRLVNNFNITFEENSIPKIIEYDEDSEDYNVVLIDELNSTHPVTQDLVDFDYLGSTLSLIGDNTAVLAWSEQVSNITVAAYVSANNSAGRVVVTGSNFMADNFGINSKYHSVHNLDFIFSVIEWITNETIFAPIQTQVTKHEQKIIGNTGIFTTSQIEFTSTVMQANQPTITIEALETFERKSKIAFRK